MRRRFVVRSTWPLESLRSGINRPSFSILYFATNRLLDRLHVSMRLFGNDRRRSPCKFSEPLRPD